MLLYVHGDRRDYYGRGALDGHLDFHTAAELRAYTRLLKLIGPMLSLTTRMMRALRRTSQVRGAAWANSFTCRPGMAKIRLDCARNSLHRIKRILALWLCCSPSFSVCGGEGGRGRGQLGGCGGAGGGSTHLKVTRPHWKTKTELPKCKKYAKRFFCPGSKHHFSTCVLKGAGKRDLELFTECKKERQLCQNTYRGYLSWRVGRAVSCRPCRLATDANRVSDRGRGEFHRTGVAVEQQHALLSQGWSREPRRLAGKGSTDLARWLSVSSVLRECDQWATHAVSVAALDVRAASLEGEGGGGGGGRCPAGWTVTAVTLLAPPSSKLNR